MPAHRASGSCARRFESEFSQLHAFRAFHQVVNVRRVEHDVPEEHLPLHFEGVIEGAVIGDFFPLRAEVNRIGNVGIPDRLRRIDAVLGFAVTQAADGAAFSAIHLHFEKLVAIDAHGPGGIELRDDAVFKLQSCVGGIVSGAFVGLAIFIPALRDVGDIEAIDTLYGAKDVIENIAPVAEHIDGHAAAVFTTVIPGRALGSLQIAFEDPVAEFAAHGKNASEKAARDEALEFQDAGEEEFVLHDAVLHPFFVRKARQFKSFYRPFQRWAFRSRRVCRHLWRE